MCSLTRALADEVPARNVRVNAVAQGGSRHRQAEVRLPPDADPRVARQAARPVGNAEPKKVAGLVASRLDEGRAQTGSIVSIDGGLTIEKGADTVSWVEREPPGPPGARRGWRAFGGQNELGDAFHHAG